MGDDDSDFSEERVWTITSRWFYFFPSYFLFPVPYRTAAALRANGTETPSEKWGWRSIINRRSWSRRSEVHFCSENKYRGSQLTAGSVALEYGRSMLAFLESARRCEMRGTKKEGRKQANFFGQYLKYPHNPLKCIKKKIMLLLLFRKTK